MNDLKSLSIADLKATLDYVEKLKKEHLDDLTSQGEDTKNNRVIEKYDRLEFLAHRELFERINQLMKF